MQALKEIIFGIFLLPAIFAASLMANDSSFTLVDKVCVTIGQERPILYSEVMKRARELGEDHKTAQRELIKERALIIYAKKQVTYNAPEIKKATQAHINKIIESNRLTRDRFEKILRSAPYNSSFSQYEYDTEYHLTKNQIDASIASTIAPTPGEVELELKKRKNTPKQFSIAFISISPTQSLKKADSLKLQFNKAKSIKEKISRMKNLDEIKKHYSGQSDVSIGDLMDYEEGTLIGHLDRQLKKNPSSRVTEPFEDDGAVTMIVKFEKKLDKKTALENVRKDLYKRAVQQRLDSITNNTLASSPVAINCDW